MSCVFRRRQGAHARQRTYQRSAIDVVSDLMDGAVCRVEDGDLGQAQLVGHPFPAEADVAHLRTGEGGEPQVEVPVQIANTAVVDGVPLAVRLHLRPSWIE